MLCPQVQYGAYAGVGTISSVIKLLFAAFIFSLLVKFSFGRNLLIKVQLILLIIIPAYCVCNSNSGSGVLYFNSSALEEFAICERKYPQYIIYFSTVCTVSRIFLFWIFLQSWTDSETGMIQSYRT